MLNGIDTLKGKLASAYASTVCNNWLYDIWQGNTVLDTLPPFIYKYKEKLVILQSIGII